MASIWLDPIHHEHPGLYADRIKLRRSLEIFEIRISKPMTAINALEFLGKDLRTPSDDLVLIERVEQIESGSDYVVQLSSPILTNYLLVKGEYKELSLCLEGNEVTISETCPELSLVSDIQAPEELDLLASSPLKYPGLFRYWVDPEHSEEVHSFRYPVPVYDWRACVPRSEASVDSEAATEILSDLEKVKSRSDFYFQKLHEMRVVLEGLASSMGVVPGAPFSAKGVLFPLGERVSVIVSRGLEGGIDGICEARASLKLVKPLVSLCRPPMLSKSSVLQNLILLLTNLDSSSELQLQVIETFEALLVPEYFASLINEDCTQSLNATILSSNFALQSREGLKKQKLDEHLLKVTAK